MKRTLLISSILLASAGSALAQAPPGPATPPQQTAPPAPNRPQNCAPMEKGAHPGAAPEGRAAPEGQTTGQSREPLGDKLAQSDGVLCPPSEIDPEMRAPAPDAGKTPVIPPPGSPGNDESVRPK